MARRKHIPEQVINIYESELDANKHYVSLQPGGVKGFILTAICGSKDDIVVSEIKNGSILEIEDGGINLSDTGPLLIECAKHGQYLGLWQPLQTGIGTGDPLDGTPFSMSFLLFPLRDVEYVRTILVQPKW